MTNLHAKQSKIWCCNVHFTVSIRFTSVESKITQILVLNDSFVSLHTNTFLMCSALQRSGALLVPSSSSSSMYFCVFCVHWFEFVYLFGSLGFVCFYDMPLMHRCIDAMWRYADDALHNTHNRDEKNRRVKTVYFAWIKKKLVKKNKMK